MGILRFLGFQSNTRYSEEFGHTIRELPPINGNPFGMEYLALPKLDIPRLAAKYFAAMETGETEDWCRCPWQIHPDDQEMKKGECRECGASSGHGKVMVHDDPPLGQEYDSRFHKFSGRRMRRTDDEPTCPVHTKEGMLLYFFEWAFDQHD